MQENEIASWNFVHEVLLAELGAIVDLADPIQWRLDDLSGWRQEGYGVEPRAPRDEDFTTNFLPSLEAANLVQARRYLAEVANWNYGNLLHHAEGITHHLDLLSQSE